MQCFKENYCRLCSKTFCCVQCRSKHEERFHNVNPECDICIYGRTVIKGASISLLTHIKSAHWPLHCVFCKKTFTSLDELVPHQKCSAKFLNFKMQETPKTPLTPTTECEPSPEVTPFYKNVKGTNSIAMAVTSTPLVPKDETEDEKITPINSQIICSYKSNLKLTGSSDSKKSERRVTFSETPLVADNAKKSKHLIPLSEQIKDVPEEDATADTTDDSCASDEEIFKTPQYRLEDQDNINNEMVVLDTGSLWESALTQFSFNNAANSVNVSLQINVTNNSSNFKEDSPIENNTTNLWSSVSNIVKSVVSNISFTAQSSFGRVSVKRSQPDNDEVEVPSMKRMKLTELKCRRPIRHVSPSYMIRHTKSRFVDKATQTEEFWM